MANPEWTEPSDWEDEPTPRYIAQHSDWWHKDSSNFGRWYVGEVRDSAAVFDAQSTPVCWMPDSPFEGGSLSHIRFVAEQGERAQLIARLLNKNAAKAHARPEQVLP